MINERKFAITHTSLWREISPSADNFVRHINLASQRFVTPYKSISPAFLNGAINETAFRLCRKAYEDNLTEFTAKHAEAERIWNDVCNWLGTITLEYSQFTNVIWTDIYEIANNIYSFLSTYARGTISFDPEFKGCGVISHCRGDIMAGGILIEVKAGDRGFRVTDLRQLLIYCALARAAGEPKIQRICLMNPRWGVSWSSSIEDAATSCGAVSSAELLGDIAQGAVLLKISN